MLHKILQYYTNKTDSNKGMKINLWCSVEIYDQFPNFLEISKKIYPFSILGWEIRVLFKVKGPLKIAKSAVPHLDLFCIFPTLWKSSLFSGYPTSTKQLKIKSLLNREKILPFCKSGLLSFTNLVLWESNWARGGRVQQGSRWLGAAAAARRSGAGEMCLRIIPLWANLEEKI